MMTYHPEFDLLLEYSAGSLNPSVSLCISTHIDYCDECRKQLAKMASIGGVLLDVQEPQSVNPALLNKIFQRIDQQANTFAGSVTVAHKDDDVIPAAIKKLVSYDLDSLQWRRHGPKVKSAELINQGGIKASLVRIHKGTSIPRHGHKGKEYTVVLDGSFSDSQGVYQRGDFIVRNAGDTHSPTAAMDKDCLCLAVLEAPMQFKNSFYEMINRINPL